MQNIWRDITEARIQAREDGQTPHKIKMHPATLRDFLEEHSDICKYKSFSAPNTVYGLLLEDDPAIPMGRVVVFDADGDLLVQVNGKYCKATDALRFDGGA